MITNLIALVITTLSTNVTERWPMHEEPSQAMLLPAYPYANYMTQQVPDKNPDTKWVRSKVTETTELKFTNGLTPLKLSERVLSDIEVSWLCIRSKTNMPGVNGGSITVSLEAWTPYETNSVLGKMFIAGSWCSVITNSSVITNTFDTYGTNITFFGVLTNKNNAYWK